MLQYLIVQFIQILLLLTLIGVSDSGYSCGYHTGVDFAPYGDTENNRKEGNKNEKRRKESNRKN